MHRTVRVVGTPFTLAAMLGGLIVSLIQPTMVAGAVTYVMRDLGTLGGTTSSATRINAVGQVIGQSFTSGYTRPHAFLYSGGMMTDVGTFGGTESLANALNSAGQVVGWANLPGDDISHAFLWSGGTLMDLGTLGGTGSSAKGINDDGQVVGYIHYAVFVIDASLAFLYSGGVMNVLGILDGRNSVAEDINAAGEVVGSAEVDFNHVGHAFLYSAGVMTDLGTLGGSDSVATRINDGGEVIGGSATAVAGASHAFLYRAGVMTDLGTLGGDVSQATDINVAGQVVGYAYTAGNVNEHAFLYSDGVMVDLGTLGGDYSEATGVNATGQVVGYSATASAYRAFLYSAGQMLDLGTLGGVNSVANGLNDAGEVVGWAQTSDGTVYHAFLASPCGDGVVNSTEDCDDGASTGTPDSCCAVDCRFRPRGAPCTPDVNLCTNAVCDGSGTCMHPDEPAPNCIVPTSRGATLKVMSRPDVALPDEVQFNWGKGPVVPLADFGTPGNGTDYALCVYDGRASGLVYEGRPVGQCDIDACWSATSTGWKFSSMSGTPDGITRVMLKDGLVPGKAKVQARAKGVLALGSLPLQISPNVIAQVRTSSGKCWGATFSTATRNDPGQFVAKSD